MRGTESQSTIKDLKDSTQLVSNCLTKLNSYRESANKQTANPVRSMSKRETINL